MTAGGTTTAEIEASSSRRKLLLHDGVAFLALTLLAVGLFGVTLFLFRSFEEHRAELAQRWGQRGRSLLEAGHAEAAIIPLRTAISYAPDDRSSAMLLAQALGEAGHTEEATNYFLSLWDTRPGDGFLNLQLARLERRKKDPAAATNYYRAAVYGTWEGDGVTRRREVRLELARYLIDQHDLRAAQAELQVAAGNAPANAELDELFGDRFAEASDPADALVYYKRAISEAPHDLGALSKAGTLAYNQGDYVEARRLLARAVRESAGTRRGTGAEQVAGTAKGQMDAMYDKADRMVDLAPFPSLSAGARAQRVVEIRAIAQQRMTACLAGAGTAGGTVAPALAGLITQWLSPEVQARQAALAADETKQDALLKLAFDTELQTSKVCGQPSGDDALLLRLSQGPQTFYGGESE